MKSIIFYKNRFFKDEFKKIVNVKLKLDSHIASFHSSSPYYDKILLINKIKELNLYDRNNIIIECCSNIGSDTNLFMNNYNKTISYECDEETHAYLVYNMFLLNERNNIYFTGNKENIKEYIRNYDKKENELYNNENLNYDRNEIKKVEKYRNKKDVIDYNKINREDINIKNNHNIIIYESFDVSKLKNIKDLYKDDEYVFYYDPPWMNEDKEEENKLYIKDKNNNYMLIEDLIKETINITNPKLIIIKYRNKINLNINNYKINFLEIKNKDNLIKYNFTLLYK